MSLVFVVSRGIFTSDVARVDLLAVLHHEVRAGRQEVALLVALRRLDDDRRRALLGVADASTMIFCERPVTLSVSSRTFSPSTMSWNVDLAADLGEDGRGERIPVDQLAGRRRRAARRAPGA